MSARPILALDLEGAANAVSLSPRTWQTLVRNGEAPKPRMVSGRRVVWLVAEIQAWLAARPVSDLPPPPNTGKKKGRAGTEEATPA